MYSVFIVEDHTIMLEMLKVLIGDEAGLEVSGTAATGEEALERLLEAQADLVLIDVSLPGINGIELAAEIKSEWPDKHCLMLSGHQEIVYVKRSFAAGAQGYVAKGDPCEIPKAVRRILEGEEYVSKPMRDKL